MALPTPEPPRLLLGDALGDADGDEFVAPAAASSPPPPPPPPPDGTKDLVRSSSTSSLLRLCVVLG